MSRFDCSGISAESFASSGQLEAAAGVFIKEGYVILDNVLPRPAVEALHREFLAEYGARLKEEETEQSRAVSNRRYMMPVRFAGGFADPAVFANPVVLALIRKLLEPTAILEAYGCFVSLPGAAKQREHYDGPHLFGTRLSALLPPYALTFALPLVDMDEVQGSTMLMPGSHRWNGFVENADSFLPKVPQGSCALWDYRLYHYGTENRSDRPRPMLYCTYARPWYKDPVNFREIPRMKRLDCSPAFIAGLPDDVRSLLEHALGTVALDEASR